MAEYITWRDLIKSFENIEENRLDDRATLWENGEFKPVDLLEIDCPEINDSRLVVIKLEDLD